MIDFENDNPYAPPSSSGGVHYDGQISNTALQYLDSARKWSLFYVIMMVLMILVSLFSNQDIASIFAAFINIAIYGALGFFAWKYTQNARLIQIQSTTEQLAQCVSSLNTILIINGVLFILGLLLIGIAFLFAMIAAVVSGF